MTERRRPFVSTIACLAFAGLLAGGYIVYTGSGRGGYRSVAEFVGRLPFSESVRNRTEALGMLADTAFSMDDRERTYLILFQNDLELRPGGGFIGSFGILKVKNARVTTFSVHDTGMFDAHIPDLVDPPYPMQETARVRSWKLRDSNWAPDFPTNARQAEEFYRMGGGEEHFDGVIGVTSRVLSSMLSVTGPVRIPGYPGEYGEENAILDLEYQVEQGYREQGIGFGERKSVMGILGGEILSRIKRLSPKDFMRLTRVVLEDLSRKDAQLFFEDDSLQRQVVSAGWGGTFDQDWEDDFLMVVDANLDAWKTDSVMQRSIHHHVDLSQNVPRARLTVSYQHAGFERNFMVKDYQTYVRVFVPEGSHFRSVVGGSEAVYGNFLGRKYVGTIVQVPLGTARDIVFEYDLPKNFVENQYDLLLVRQPGTKDVPVSLTVIGRDGARLDRDLVLDRDFRLGFEGEE